MYACMYVCVCMYIYIYISRKCVLIIHIFDFVYMCKHVYEDYYSSFARFQLKLKIWP